MTGAVGRSRPEADLGVWALERPPDLRSARAWRLRAGPYRSGKLIVTSTVLRLDGWRWSANQLQSRRLGDRACLGDNSSSRLT